MVGRLAPSTIGDFIEGGITLSIYCDACLRGAELDLVAVGARLGLDHDLYTGWDVLGPLLVCKRCGGRQFSRIVGMPGPTRR